MLFNILIILSISYSFSQHVNQRAIEINNNYDAAYINIPGTKVSLIPAKGFKISNRFSGLEDELSGSSIMITEIPGDVHKIMLGFDKKYLFKAGIIVESQVYYKINSYDALFIIGKQSAYERIYEKYMLIIGDIQTSYLLSASVLSTAPDNHKKEVKASLLSVIYNPESTAKPSDRFDFSIDVSGTLLKKGNLMLSSLTYTDDGNVPSKTENKTSVTVRKSKLIKELTESEKQELTKKIFELYPKEITGDINICKEIKGNYLSGYEMYAIGTNKDTEKPELIYLAVFFNGKEYYVFTGLTYGNFEKNLEMFRKVAKTLNTNTN